MNAILYEYLLTISDSCSKNVQSLNQFNIQPSHIIHIRIYGSSVVNLVIDLVMNLVMNLDIHFK